jgi:hypothetical protein
MSTSVISPASAWSATAGKKTPKNTASKSTSRKTTPKNHGVELQSPSTPLSSQQPLNTSQFTTPTVKRQLQFQSSDIGSLETPSRADSASTTASPVSSADTTLNSLLPPRSPIIGNERYDREKNIQKSLDLVDFSAFYSTEPPPRFALQDLLEHFYSQPR